MTSPRHNGDHLGRTPRSYGRLHRSRHGRTPRVQHVHSDDKNALADFRSQFDLSELVMRYQPNIKPISAVSYAIDPVEAFESESAIGTQYKQGRQIVQISFPLITDYVTITPLGCSTNQPFSFSFSSTLSEAALVTGENRLLIIQIELEGILARVGRIGIGYVPVELATYRPLVHKEKPDDYVSFCRNFGENQECTGRLFVSRDDEKELFGAFSASSLDTVVKQGQLLARESMGVYAGAEKILAPKIGVSSKGQTLMLTTTGNTRPLVTATKPLQTPWGLLAHYQIVHHMLGGQELDALAMTRAVDMLRPLYDKDFRPPNLQSWLTKRFPEKPSSSCYVPAA